MYNCKFEWPNGAHIAVVFNMSWETWERSLGTADNNQKAKERVPRDAKYGRGMRWIYEHAFAETGGMQRLLDIWKRHDIKTSAYADGHTVSLFPDLARAVVRDGHEIILQGWEHNYFWDMTAEEQADSIDRTIDVFDKVLGLRAPGFSSPGGHLTAETFPLLAKRGFTYACGLRNADVPFIMTIDGHKMVGMTSYALTDFMNYNGNEVTPRAIMEMWRDAFDAMYEEGQRGWNEKEVRVGRAQNRAEAQVARRELQRQRVDGGRIEPRRPIGDADVTRLCLARLFHQPGYVGDCRVRPGGGDAHRQRSIEVQRAGMHLAPFTHGLWRAFAG